MSMIKLSVDGMTCQNCVKHVTEALSEVPGVETVDVKLEDNAAFVVVGEAFTEQAAASALGEAGYKMGEAERV